MQHGMAERCEMGQKIRMDGPHACVGFCDKKLKPPLNLRGKQNNGRVGKFSNQKDQKLIRIIQFAKTISLHLQWQIDPVVAVRQIQAC